MKRITRPMKTSQRGVVLFITLIVLVALAMAALAMFRSSMGATLVATNVANRQATFALADTAVTVATNAVLIRAQAGLVNADDATIGYSAAIPATEPNWSDPAVWFTQSGWITPSCATSTQSVCLDSNTLCGGDAACMAKANSFTVSYKVHRMCTLLAGTWNCAQTQKSGATAPGNTQTITPTTPTPPGNPMYYYRITTRVDGPRNTRTVTQTVVALQT